MVEGGREVSGESVEDGGRWMVARVACMAFSMASEGLAVPEASLDRLLEGGWSGC